MSINNSQRTSDDIVKMLACHIIHEIYNGVSDSAQEWLQIGPITDEARNELKLTHGEFFDMIHTFNIVGHFSNLIVKVDAINITLKIKHTELIELVKIAIKYRIPIKDFYPGVCKNCNLDNPMIGHYGYPN